MILQSLANYYIRKARNTKRGGHVAPYGMEYKEIKFIVEITRDGCFEKLVDMRDEKKHGKALLVPKSAGRSGSASWQTANLLWDHYGYVLGQSKAGTENPNAEGQLRSFIARMESLPEDLKNEEDISAVIKFYRQGAYKKVIEDSKWPECHKIAGCNMTFRVSDESRVVTENPKLCEWAASASGSAPEEGGVAGRCLVTGEIGEIARTHAKIGVGGSQANLVGFQKDSGYDSYGKEQGYNAPVSKKAEFYYTTALKTLLDSATNRVRIGNAVLLFWAEPSSLSEEDAENAELAVRALIYGARDSGRDNADAGVRNVENIFKAIFKGKVPTATADKFCILGIAPNKARLSVVLWKRGTLEEIAQNIYQYLEDIRIMRGKDEVEPSVYDIMRASEYQGKIENVPSNMIPAMVYSIFNGASFPSSVFGHVMNRIRAERNPSGVRVAFVKAYLNRKYKNTKGAEIKVSLDKNNMDTAYRLGRLLAVLQKLQEEANKRLKTTLKDRFYRSMSSTPASVLPTLLRLKNHHLGKLEVGRKIYFEQLMAEIFSGFQPNKIPKHMSLEEQGNFAVGYYHQRDDLFKGRENKTADTSSGDETNE